MSRIRVAGAAVLVLALASCASATDEPAPEGALPIRVMSTSATFTDLPTVVIVAQGYFEQVGLDAEFDFGSASNADPRPNTTPHRRVRRHLRSSPAWRRRTRRSTRSRRARGVVATRAAPRRSAPEILDRIDELVAPGVTINPEDNSYGTVELAASARRR